MDKSNPDKIEKSICGDADGVVIVDCAKGGDCAADNPADGADCSMQKNATALRKDADVSIGKDGETSKYKKNRNGKPRKKHNLWSIKITFISLFLSAFISFISQMTASSEHMIVTVLLLFFLILASILFDGIGVAATSCDIKPIIAMASRKIYGAKTALWLLKNNEKVSNVCNDVIGDIFGIISGACTVAIVAKIILILGDSWQKWLAIGLSSVVAALTIGGKAFLKNFAINNSKEFVMFVARVIAIFSAEERRRKKKQDRKKKEFAESKLVAETPAKSDVIKIEIRRGDEVKVVTNQNDDAKCVISKKDNNMKGFDKTAAFSKDEAKAISTKKDDIKVTIAQKDDAKTTTAKKDDGKIDMSNKAANLQKNNMKIDAFNAENSSRSIALKQNALKNNIEIAVAEQKLNASKSNEDNKVVIKTEINNKDNNRNNNTKGNNTKYSNTKDNNTKDNNTKDNNTKGKIDAP